MAEVIGQRTMHISDSKILAKKIAAYLLVEHKTAQLDSLLRDIVQYRAEHGVVEAVAISVNGLNETVRGDIRAMLKAEFPSAKAIAFHEQRDPSVIGGLRVDLPNEQLDMTARAKLNHFKRLTGAGKEY